MVFSSTDEAPAIPSTGETRSSNFFTLGTTSDLVLPDVLERQATLLMAPTSGFSCQTTSDSVLPSLDHPIPENYFGLESSFPDSTEFSGGIPFSWPWPSFPSPDSSFSDPLASITAVGLANASESPSSIGLAASSLLSSVPGVGVEDPFEAPLSDSLLIPNIASFFERLHPIMPVFSRSWLFDRIDRDEHRTCPAFAAMLLAMSALAMVQPVKTSERSARSVRFLRARGLLEESAKTGASLLLGQGHTLDAVLTSFYTFACLFGLQEHGAAAFRLSV